MDAEQFERIMQKVAAGVTVFTEWIAISLLWLVGCIPVVTIAASSAAAYYAAVKAVRRKRGSVLRAYCDAFRENWRQSIPCSLVFAGLAALLLFYWLTMGTMADSGLQSVYIGLVILVLLLFLAVTAYFFPVLSRFRQGLGRHLQMSLSMAAGHPLRTLGAVVLLAAGGVLSWLCFPLIALLPGLYCWGISFIIEPVLRGAVDRNAVDDEDPWYLES